MSRRLVINVSGTASWRRRPVGIVRVERELAKQFRRLSPGDLYPVVLDQSARGYQHLQPADFDRILSDDWVHADDPETAAPLDSRNRQALAPRKTDLFVSVGSDWSFRTPDLVDDIYSGAKVLVSACHDIIPLIRPEYTPGPEFFDQFSHHYNKIRRAGRSVFSVSANSRQDLIKFWTAADSRAPMPPVHVVPLAGKKAEATPVLGPNDMAALEQLKGTGSFVLYVSTLEPRKNHRLLLDMWRELFLERGDQCPRLLLIGMRGWGCDDFLLQLSRMPAARAAKVTWREGVSDDLLIHLYQNALFSVFPSIYEGWGLAATESLSHGKVCVVANNSSLLEATQGLVPGLHPLDFKGWKAEIERLIDDVAYRESIESRIGADFRQRTWHDFGDDFFRTMVEAV